MVENDDAEVMQCALPDPDQTEVQAEFRETRSDIDLLYELAMKTAGMSNPPKKIGDLGAEYFNEDLAQNRHESVLKSETSHATPQADPDWRENELSKLPGAGPGLIWMLKACQITSLEQLALQDDEALSRKLGVVGQIIDVGRWIDFARDDAAEPQEPDQS